MVNLQRKNGFGSSTVQEFLQLCKSLELKTESFILLINLCPKAQRQYWVLVCLDRKWGIWRLLDVYGYFIQKIMEITFKVGKGTFHWVNIEKYYKMLDDHIRNSSLDRFYAV